MGALSVFGIVTYLRHVHPGLGAEECVQAGVHGVEFNGALFLCV